jgi:2-dehydro-3-deoxygalactonokinase
MDLSREHRYRNVMNGSVAWIAVDWGTSNLRAWAMDDAGRAIANAASEAGMARLSRDDFEPTLLSVIDGWLASGRKTRIVACGMVGARQGWMEAPYASVPCTPVTQTVAPECRDRRIEVHILAGIRQHHPPDVMRGEETQIAGMLLREPGFEGVICLPGTHTKWAEVAGGIITRFTTFMTGELFGLLSTQSVLRHSVPAGTEWDDEAFAAAVVESAVDTRALTAGLFSVRAATLVADVMPAVAKARLSGLLIGAELAGTQAMWSRQRVLIAGNGRQGNLYSEALTRLGAASLLIDASELTLAGLIAANAVFAEDAP